MRAVYFGGVERRASYQIEYRARRADGEYRHMLSTASPRYIGSVYAGHVGTVLDITDLKRRQEEHLARQKLESLGTLAGGIAHDFNNLLGGILSQTELALAELAEGASPEAEMKNIHAVALRGAEIVRQLMVYAGQETDTLELVDVSRLVEETVELLKVVVSKHAEPSTRAWYRCARGTRQPGRVAPDPGQPGDQRIRSHGRARCGDPGDARPESRCDRIHLHPASRRAIIFSSKYPIRVAA